MLRESFILVISIVFLLLPLVFWLYILVQLRKESRVRVQFLLWICIGTFTACILNFYKELGLEPFFKTLFLNIWSVDISLNERSIITSFASVFAVFWVFFFIFKAVFTGQIPLVKYSTSYVYMLGVVVCTSLLIFSLSLYISGSDPLIRERFGDIIFYSYTAIIWYYLVISLLEEGVKFIGWYGFYSTLWDLDLRVLISVAICISLWFAFFENILYSIFYVKENSIDYSLITLIFFRSIFSVLLHIFASACMVIAFYYILYSKKIYILRIWLFGCFIILSILGHSIYDLGLTFGHTWVIFLYIFATYFLLTYMCFRVDRVPDHSLYQ